MNQSTGEGRVTVYLVVLGDGDYEPAWVDSVWSTEAKAKGRVAEYLRDRTPRDTPDAVVEAWKVDTLG